MTDFYVTLVSNAHSDSTISNFQSSLPSTLRFNRPYEVALSSIIYPNSQDLISNNLESDGRYENEFIVVFNNKKVKCKVQNCSFSTPAQLVDILNYTYQKKVKTVTNSIDKEKDLLFTYKPLFRTVTIENLKHVTQVELSDRLSYFLGVEKISTKLPTTGQYSMFSGSELMYIYSDGLVEPQTISHMKAPLLKIISISPGNDRNVEESFTNPLYVQVRAREVDRIEKRYLWKMAKLMNSKSSPSAPANICLFDTPPSQVAFNKGKWMTFSPSNAVDSEGPYTFNIYDSAHFFQLNKTYLSFKLRLKDVEKTEHEGKKVAQEVSCTNFIGATFFNQVKLSFNNVMVYDSDYYAYKSYIQTLFGENLETKEGLLSAAGWMDDGEKRKLEEDRDLDIYAPLLLEPFQTDRLLIPHINIQLTLYRNRDAFCLLSTADTKAQLVVSDLKLHMRAIDVVSSATIAMENRLRTTPAQYPFTVTKGKIIGIPEGRFEMPFSTLYHDIIPRRIIVGLLSPDVSTTTDPLNFGHYNISEIQLDAGGTMYPPQPILTDFENKNYAHAFARFYDELGCVTNNSCPKITYKMFRDGFTFFVFNLSPLDSSNSWELVQSGSTQLLMRFKNKTPAGGLNVLVLSQFDGEYTIDGFRNVTVNTQH
ncbi:hypothetical protein CAEBREN_29981 [Caenorhabditis brenneri]|uniref:PAZ domain-containing protein n=1 Tax=Caenorhabditis brenneri TaxID=135651 RepID=G0PL78_CAEBE|nr:hypothetical protein CAEBREN_29981 [Caenorhabditis brenneri]